MISLLAQNVWRYLHWEYVATPRRGGRRLWWWPFEEFIEMVTRAAWTALAVRRGVPANRPPPTATIFRRFIHDSLIEIIRETAPTPNSGFRNS